MDCCIHSGARWSTAFNIARAFWLPYLYLHKNAEWFFHVTKWMFIYTFKKIQNTIRQNLAKNLGLRKTRQTILGSPFAAFLLSFPSMAWVMALLLPLSITTLFCNGVAIVNKFTLQVSQQQQFLSTLFWKQHKCSCVQQAITDHLGLSQLPQPSQCCSLPKPFCSPWVTVQESPEGECTLYSNSRRASWFASSDRSKTTTPKSKPNTWFG